MLLLLLDGVRNEVYQVEQHLGHVHFQLLLVDLWCQRRVISLHIVLSARVSVIDTVQLLFIHRCFRFEHSLSACMCRVLHHRPLAISSQCACKQRRGLVLARFLEELFGPTSEAWLITSDIRLCVLGISWYLFIRTFVSFELDSCGELGCSCCERSVELRR